VFLAEVYEVETADLQEIVTGFGTAKADREVLVAAQVAGEIVELHPRLRAGETVQAPGVAVSPSDGTRELPGDVLVRIDDRAYRERFRQAETRLAEDATELQRLTVEEENTRRLLETARRDYETIQAEYDRIEKLRGTSAVTPSQLARAVVELRQFESKLIALQNEAGLFGVRREQIERRTAVHRIDRETAERDLRNTVVRPPFAGSLAEVHVDQGQFVRAAEPICRLVDVAHVEVAVPVVLADHARLSAELHAGRTPRVTLAENETAAPRWTGHLARVAPVADERTRTIRVYVDVHNAEQESPLLPGAFVHARIAAGTLRQVRVVPRDVVRSGRTYVVGGERAEPREVRTGRTIGGLVVIESGLADGDRLPTTNLEALRPGAKIAPGGRRTLDAELAQQALHVVRAERSVSSAGPGPER
jgi:multidrug efflux pump subunit AcrA (membrane-fusion protein)